MAIDVQISDRKLGAVMITGASSGIGRACALHLDRRGYRVFAGVRKTSDAEALTAAAPNLVPVMIDVTDAKAIANVARQVEAALGGLAFTGLVNNAGVGVGAPAEFLDLSELRRQLEVNFVGPLALIQAFMPLIRRSRGRIVNVSSIGGRTASPFLSPYNASKFALEALSDSMRMELKPWGINVSVIEPGSIQSSMWGKGRETVDTLSKSLPAEAMRLYGDGIATMRKVLMQQEQMAIPAERVAKAIEHALSASRPRTRYLVGLDAKISAFLHWILPDRTYDAFIAMMMRRMLAGASRARDATSPAAQP
jgi:NAD(P)-dependent dehydrogenase (short-subunit alcohol dehydrogenase family)